MQVPPTAPCALRRLAQSLAVAAYAGEVFRREGRGFHNRVEGFSDEVEKASGSFERLPDGIRRQTAVAPDSSQ